MAHQCHFRGHWHTAYTSHDLCWLIINGDLITMYATIWWSNISTPQTQLIIIVLGSHHNNYLWSCLLANWPQMTYQLNTCHSICSLWGNPHTCGVRRHTITYTHMMLYIWKYWHLFNFAQIEYFWGLKCIIFSTSKFDTWFLTSKWILINEIFLPHEHS